MDLEAQSPVTPAHLPAGMLSLLPRTLAILVIGLWFAPGCTTVPGDTGPTSLSPTQALAAWTKDSGADVPQIQTVAHMSAAEPDADPPPKAADTKAPATAPAKADDGHADLLPAPRPAGAMSLDQVIGATLLAHPVILAGLEVINQAHAVEKTSALLPNPSLLADIQLLPISRSFTVDRTGGPPQTDYQIILPIDWFLFGKRAAAMASAAAGSSISEANFTDLVRQTVRDAALAYYDVLESKMTLAMEREILDELRDIEAFVRKNAADKKRATNLSRLENEAFKQERTLRDAESALTTALARLRARVGLRNGEPAIGVAGSLTGPLAGPPPTVEQALALAEQNRPDIHSLRLQVRKADLDVRTQKVNAYPQVAPMVGYTRQFQERTIGVPDANSWDFTLNMTVPIFNRNQYGIAGARSALNQSTLNLEAGLIQLRADIVQAVQDLVTNEEHTKALTSQRLKASEELRQNVEQDFRKDGGDLLDVLDAIHNHHDIVLLAITSRAAYLRAIVRLNAAIGKQVVAPAAQAERR